MDCDADRHEHPRQIRRPDRLTQPPGLGLDLGGLVDVFDA
jgi:hypothetical protein